MPGTLLGINLVCTRVVKRCGLNTQIYEYFIAEEGGGGGGGGGVGLLGLVRFSSRFLKGEVISMKPLGVNLQLIAHAFKYGGTMIHQVTVSLRSCTGKFKECIN